MYQIIQPTPDDFDELTCLWEASVRATYHFIPEAYIQKLKPLVWSVYLHSMPLYMIRDNAGIEGFMGINGTMLEMLFVHPRAIGTGIGKQLMRYALEHCHVRYVDVNEQNKKASGFYGHFGFRVIGRDAKDASGEPYPILHLKLGGIMKIENWGLVPYSEAWKRQTELFNAVVEAKQVGKRMRIELFCRTSACLYIRQEWKGNEYAAGGGTIEDDWCHPLSY